MWRLPQEQEAPGLSIVWSKQSPELSALLLATPPGEGILRIIPAQLGKWARP